MLGMWPGIEESCVLYYLTHPHNPEYSVSDSKASKNTCSECTVCGNLECVWFCMQNFDEHFKTGEKIQFSVSLCGHMDIA